MNERFRDARQITGALRTKAVARALASYEQNNRIVPEPIVVEPPGPDMHIDEAAGIDPSGPAVRNRYNQGPLLRLASIVFIAFATVAFTGAMVSGVESVTRVMQRHQIDISDPPYRQ